jgi:ABC-2 type transport system ATP-binding protein
MPQIVLNHITKVFSVSERGGGGLLGGTLIRKKKRVRALDDISFTIDEGELVGYIGPNGAGKSTTVKVMSGILTPEEGECVIIGRTPWKERVAHVSQIGVVFGQRSQLWWDVPVRDSFELLKDIYGIPTQAYKRRLDSLVGAMDASRLLSTPVRQLSLGQRMRCEVIAALLHSPRVVFLDEPTIGLDAVSKLALREFLKNENRQNGVTMILTTHDMDDIGALCERVMVIGHGKLLFNGVLKDLKRRYAPLKRIDASSGVSIGPIEIEGADKIEIDGRKLRCWFDPEITPAHKIVAGLAERLPLEDITVSERDIDEMIAAMYREMKL